MQIMSKLHPSRTKCPVTGINSWSFKSVQYGTIVFVLTSGVITLWRQGWVWLSYSLYDFFKTGNPYLTINIIIYRY